MKIIMAASYFSPRKHNVVTLLWIWANIKGELQIIALCLPELVFSLARLWFYMCLHLTCTAQNNWLQHYCQPISVLWKFSFLYQSQVQVLRRKVVVWIYIHDTRRTKLELEVSIMKCKHWTLSVPNSDWPQNISFLRPPCSSFKS